VHQIQFVHQPMPFQQSNVRYTVTRSILDPLSALAQQLAGVEWVFAVSTISRIVRRCRSAQPRDIIPLASSWSFGFEVEA